MELSPYLASLRVYEPISCFTESDQIRWKSIPAGLESKRLEQELSLRRIITLNFDYKHGEGAHFLERNGKRFISPWTSSLRFWLALEEFQNSVPSSVLPFLIPNSLIDSLNLQNHMIEYRIPHTINERWMIPPRWFALFSPEDRQRGENSGDPYTILQTSLSKAKERCELTHRIIYKAFGPGPVEEEIRELLSWLEQFHVDSLVECDYGGLATYLNDSLIRVGESGLEADTSVEDVAMALDALSRGDGKVAGERYELLMSRWRRVAALEQAT